MTKNISELQRRNRPATFQTREDESGARYFEGYFVVFDSPYKMFDGYTETIDPTAFDTALKEHPDVRCLYNHDDDVVLGRTSSGSFVWTVDEKGVYGQCLVNEDDTAAKDIYARVKRGDVNQASFGFWIKDSDETMDENGGIHSNIKDVELVEFSICSFPAYQDTHIEARANSLRQKEKRTQTEHYKKMLLTKLKGGD